MHGLVGTKMALRSGFSWMVITAAPPLFGTMEAAKGSGDYLVAKTDARDGGLVNGSDTIAVDVEWARIAQMCCPG